MANVLVNEDSLSDIADAIRSKLGVSDTYKPSEMASAIGTISGGGITPTGTINITTNGTTDVTQYASANVAVPASAVDSGTKSISSNGTHDVVGYASASVSVANSYTSSDEGKVVSNGALVAQTSDTVTQNGTVDTTLINSLLVNVASSGGVKTANGSFTLTGTSGSVQSQTITHNANMTPLIGLMYMEMDSNDQVVASGGYQIIYGIFVNTLYVTPTANSLYDGGTIVSNYTSSATKTASYSSVDQYNMGRIVSCWTNQAAQWRTTDKIHDYLEVVDSNTVKFSMFQNGYYRDGTYKWVLWGA